MKLSHLLPWVLVVACSSAPVETVELLQPRFSGDLRADGTSSYQGDAESCAPSVEDELRDAEGEREHYYTVRVDEACDAYRVALATPSGRFTTVSVDALTREADGLRLEAVRTRPCGDFEEGPCSTFAAEPGEYVVTVWQFRWEVSSEGEVLNLPTDYRLSVGCGSSPTCEPGCADSSECAEGEQCIFATDAACGEAGRGTCAAPPTDCPTNFAEVCGCDGETYANACIAEARGVSVAAEFRCELGGGSEGDRCEDGAGCSPGLLCDTSGNDACGGSGICIVDDPLFCPANFVPVCGCDGITYSNDCERANAGVAKAGDGACTTVAGEDEACGGATGAACDDGLLCDRSSVLECDTNAAGVCRDAEPRVCPTNFNPVCGCDGMTYSNSCFLVDAGIPAAGRGACE